MATRDTDPRLQRLIESLDLAAYLARTGSSRDRRRALDIAAQARRAAVDLAPARQAQLHALTLQVSTLALAARRDARRDSAGLGLSLLAALVGGLCIGLVLELAWSLSEY
ncbi:MAG: hypothetical protein GXP62_13765, partial [Oligoflexia bacterium]|nr:hypothetical protein [Oligoflexia bacterium]